MPNHTRDHSPCDLAGLSVLVTRPTHQAVHLCEAIELAHGRPIRFPTLEIRPTSNPKAARDTLHQPCDILVFVSRNAVEQAFPLLPDTLPGDLPIAAIGRTTAERLDELGLDPTLVPHDRFDTEGLLNLPEFQQVTGKHILIVRGHTGRETLANELTRRGAQVRYASVYESVLPQRSAGNLIQGWHELVDVVTATSNQILDNLFAILGESGSVLLQATPLVVVSPRMAQHANRRGCRHVQVAKSAMDQDLLANLCEFAQNFS